MKEIDDQKSIFREKKNYKKNDFDAQFWGQKLVQVGKIQFPMTFILWSTILTWMENRENAIFKENLTKMIILKNFCNKEL